MNGRAGFDRRVHCGSVSRSGQTSDVQLVLQWLLCQVLGDVWSALGLVGLVSVYCDWVRKTV